MALGLRSGQSAIGLKGTQLQYLPHIGFHKNAYGPTATC